MTAVLDVAAVRHAGRRRNGVVVGVGIAVAVTVGLAALSFGAAGVSPDRVLAVLLGGGERLERFVVLDLRLPRILAALLVGAAFALAGAVFQSTLRNPLASPDILGISTGASLGAVWATCASEFGPRSVLDRLGQLEPTVLLAIAGYRYGDRHVDRREQVSAVRAGLPSLRHVVHVPYAGGPDDALPDTVTWDELLAEPGPLEFDPVPFAHPLYVLFSSGTTGLPKAIVHGHGGILLEHCKNLGLCFDIKRGDRLLWSGHATTW